MPCPVGATDGPPQRRVVERRGRRTHGALTALKIFQTSGRGYFVEMSTRPQTIGYALLDSPAARRLGDRPRHRRLQDCRAFVGGQPSGNLTRDRIPDNITAYWLTGTGTSAARSYWVAYAPAAGVQPLPDPRIPARFRAFPGEIWKTPRS